MKKLISLLLAVLLIVGMVIPVSAATPKLDIPDIPAVPDISDDIHVELPDGFWADYFKQNPLPAIKIPAAEDTKPIVLEPISFTPIRLYLWCVPHR